jgi:hypothetical protein
VRSRTGLDTVSKRKFPSPRRESNPVHQILCVYYAGKLTKSLHNQVVIYIYIYVCVCVCVCVYIFVPREVFARYLRCQCSDSVF